MSEFVGAAVFSFFLFLIGVPMFMFFVRLAGLYAIVEERTAHVYVLFGSVVGVIEEPGEEASRDTAGDIAGTTQTQCPDASGGTDG